MPRAATLLRIPKPLPTLVAAQRITAASGSVTNGNTKTLVGTAITVNANDLLVFKAASGNATLYASDLSWTGITGTRTMTSVYFATAAYCPYTFWTGTLSGGGTITPTVTYTATASVSTTMDCIVERWANARAEPAPAYAGASPASGTSISTTITPATSTGIITWAAADYTATSPAGNITLLNSAQRTIADYLSSGIIGVYSGYQPTVTGGVAQTFGLTSGSVAQKDMICAIELKPIAA